MLTQWMTRKVLSAALALLSCLLVRPASALVWTPETIDDPVPSMGDFSDIALDASGRPHIVYRDPFNFDLKYATKRASGTWDIELVESSGQAGFGLAVALDAAGNVHVSYFRAPDATSNGSVHYAKRTCLSWFPTFCSWSRQTIEVGVQSRTRVNFTSIAVDSAGNPHVSYVQNVTGQLRWAKHTPSEGWSITNVTPLVSGATAIDVDAFDFPQITFSDSSSGLVRHARIACVFILCGWNIETVDSGSLGAMKLSTDDFPHVVYVRSGTLHHAVRTCPAAGTGACPWTLQVVGSTGAPQRPDLALDGANAPHVTFLRERGFGIADLMYGRRVGGTWLLEIADLDARSLGASAIALTSGNLPQLSFQSSTAQALRITRGVPRVIRPPIGPVGPITPALP